MEEVLVRTEEEVTKEEEIEKKEEEKVDGVGTRELMEVESVEIVTVDDGVDKELDGISVIMGVLIIRVDDIG